MRNKPIHKRARFTRLAVLALALGVVAMPASADAYVYWVNATPGTIGRANLDGTGANQNFISAARPCEVAVDAAHVYWTDGSSGSIGRANLDGSSVDRNFITGATTPCGIAVDATHIYWTNFTNPGSIGRANLDGSSPNPNFIPGIVSPGGVAVNADHVYWTQSAMSGSIGRANLNGTSPNPNFIPGIANPFEMTIDGAHVYWANDGGPSTIGRANLDGTGTPEQSFITGFSSVYGVAVDGQHIYWVDDGDDTIGRANLDGTSLERNFISGGRGTYGIAVDSLPHASTTTVECAPHSVVLPGSTNCTVTVAATTPGPAAPAGSVAFASDGGGVFGPAQSCALTAIAADRSACQITYTPSTAGHQTITGSFSGDFANAQSAAPAGLDVAPSNDFSLGKLKHNKHKGTATLTASVPGLGTLALAGDGIKHQSTNALGAGDVKLKIVATKDAARTLAEDGKVKLTAKITFTPVGGDPNAISKKLTLRTAG